MPELDQKISTAWKTNRNNIKFILVNETISYTQISKCFVKASSYYFTYNAHLFMMKNCH